MSQLETLYELHREAGGAYRFGGSAADYIQWLEQRVLEARALAKTCYDHSVFPADSSEVAFDAQAKFEKWGMR